MKHGFKLVEMIFTIAMLMILVAGFAKITERTFEQIQLKTLKNELASHLVEWTLSKLEHIKYRELPGKYFFVGEEC